MEPYYKLVPYAIKESTRQKLLDLAYEPDAFVDISYKISFFKLPNKLQKFNTTGLDCVCQLLRVNESGSTVHKDKNRHNEFDGTWIPRQTVISFALTENCGETYFYDEKKEFVCNVNYEGYGAILNTGEQYHNVHFTNKNNTRIVFQLCFENKFNEVSKIYNPEIRI
jgi:hypothetical protein|tara:strand:- start:7817 stop:8317 length:501 start_codon:yes stop_codon:yes gene_type:complete